MADRPHTSNPCRNRHTDVVVQRPFTLLDPGGVGLHAVVAGVDLVHALCWKLNFLHQSRGEKDWRDATEADHTAYHYWRRLDPRGPRVDGDTWSQEVSHLQQFYVYAKRKQWVSEVRPGGVVARPRRRDRSPSI